MAGREYLERYRREMEMGSGSAPIRFIKRDTGKASGRRPDNGASPRQDYSGLPEGHA